jgi:ribosomal protein S18 acetylase RimI-like enzyme
MAATTHVDPAVADKSGLETVPYNDIRLLEKMRVLDKVCFPVQYGERFYHNLYLGTGLNRIAFYRELMVGVLTSRVERMPADGADDGAPVPIDHLASLQPEGEYRIYVMTIAVLPPYRKRKIATVLMKELIDDVQNNKSNLGVPISTIALHVHVVSDVLPFYERFGFRVVKTVKDYYTKLEPTNDAYLLELKVQQPAATAGKKGKK